MNTKMGFFTTVPSFNVVCQDTPDQESGDCVTLNFGSAAWSQADCGASHKFLCKWTSASRPTPPPPGNCPTGWEDIDGTANNIISF